MERAKFSDFYQIQKRQFSMTGIWPEGKRTLHSLSYIATFFISTTFYFTMTYEMLNDFNDFAKLSDTLFMFSSCTAYYVKLFTFLYNKDKVIQMLRELEKPIFTHYPVEYNVHVEYNLKISLLVTRIYQCSCTLVVVMFALFPILDHVPLPFPFSVDLGRYTPIMFFIQSAGVGVVAWNNSGIDNLLTNFMMCTAAVFEVLKNRITDARRYALKLSKTQNRDKDLSPEEIENIVVQVLRECVKMHLAAIGFVDLTNGVFSIAILCQFVASILFQCNSVLGLLIAEPGSGKFISLVIYFIVGTAQLTMYCWFGNEIILQSDSVLEACYFSEWPECGTRVRRYLFIIMERAKRPVNITAYKFSVASLASFMSVIQWSYSSLTLLYHFTADN